MLKLFIKSYFLNIILVFGSFLLSFVFVKILPPIVGLMFIIFIFNCNVLVKNYFKLKDDKYVKNYLNKK